MYLFLTYLGSYAEPAGHLVHYSHLTWSRIGAKGILISKCLMQVNKKTSPVANRRTTTETCHKHKTKLVADTFACIFF